MPLPWKKTGRVSRFSRLVAGLHHSPKRGRSLVVETGFPTSLVDLFVKNKDRLKKPSKKKSPPYSPLQTTGPPSPPSSPVPCQVSPDGLEVNSASGFEATRRNVQDLAVVNECNGSGEGYGMFEKRVFGVFLKILMVVVVALSTKKMAVGITMSAFLLFLVQYAAGSGVLVFLKPCSKARAVLNSFVVMIKVLYFSNSISKKEIDEVDDEIQRCNEDSSEGQLIDTSDVCDSFEFVDEIALKSPGREIQVADSNCDGEQCDVLICKKDRSRSEKLRRKFVKKFVPKKLRDAKKEWKNREREKEREKKKEKVSDSNSEIGLSGMKDENLQKISDQEQDFVVGNSQVEVGKVVEIVERERKVNSGYFWILLFVVLGGLLGGRVLALLCTLGWCLMLKLVTLCRRNGDV